MRDYKGIPIFLAVDFGTVLFGWLVVWLPEPHDRGGRCRRIWEFATAPVWQSLARGHRTLMSLANNRPLFVTAASDPRARTISPLINHCHSSSGIRIGFRRPHSCTSEIQARSSSHPRSWPCDRHSDARRKPTNRRATIEQTLRSFRVNRRTVPNLLD